VIVAAPAPTKSDAAKPDWRGLWFRTQRRCVTTLDLLEILLFDAIILVFGNGLVHLTSKFIVVGDDVFQVALKLSHGLFLLLYVIVVTFHIVEFVQEHRRATASEK
jgi:hypothetical protein